MLTFVSSLTLQGNKQDLNAQRVVQRDEAEKFASGKYQPPQSLQVNDMILNRTQHGLCRDKCQDST